MKPLNVCILEIQNLKSYAIATKAIGENLKIDYHIANVTGAIELLISLTANYMLNEYNKELKKMV